MSARKAVKAAQAEEIAPAEHGVTYDDLNRPGDNAPDWWRSRIAGHGQVRVADVVNNPHNWKIHPKEQLQAIAGSVQELGYFRSATVNLRTGNLVDGHARVLVLDFHGVEYMDVEYINVSEQEEREILMLIDPLAMLATTDRPKLEALMHGSRLQHEDLIKAVSLIAEKEGIIPTAAAASSDDGPNYNSLVPKVERYKEQYGVIVICENEQHQKEIYERLHDEGLNCKVVTN